jgi:hypothetical protein
VSDPKHECESKRGVDGVKMVGIKWCETKIDVSKFRKKCGTVLNLTEREQVLENYLSDLPAGRPDPDTIFPSKYRHYFNQMHFNQYS